MTPASNSKLTLVLTPSYPLHGADTIVTARSASRRAAPSAGRAVTVRDAAHSVRVSVFRVKS